MRSPVERKRLLRRVGCPEGCRSRVWLVGALAAPPPPALGHCPAWADLTESSSTQRGLLRRRLLMGFPTTQILQGAPVRWILDTSYFLPSFQSSLKLFPFSNHQIACTPLSQVFSQTTPYLIQLQMRRVRPFPVKAASGSLLSLCSGTIP